MHSNWLTAVTSRCPEKQRGHLARRKDAELEFGAGRDAAGRLYILHVPALDHGLKHALGALPPRVGSNDHARRFGGLGAHAFRADAVESRHL